MRRITGRRLRRRARDDRGQSAVEFALVVPMLVIIIIGMVEFARVWMQYQVITDAARESARMAVIADTLTKAQKETVILEHVRAAVATAGITDTTTLFQNCQTVSTSTPSMVELYECGWDGTRGEPATVTIRAPYRFAFLNVFLPGNPTIGLTTAFTMRNE